MPSCPSEIVGNMTAMEVLKAARVIDKSMGWNDELEATLEVYDDAGNTEYLSYEDLLAELCHVGYPGELFTSAAPQDPIFWPLHGNAERFVLALQYYKDQGTISFDETWGYSHDGAASDVDLVCDWSDVSSITDMPTCTKTTCPGHKIDDLLPFSNLYMVDGLKTRFFTNAEFVEILQYDNKNLPYVYDSVTYWESCTDKNLISEAELVSGGDTSSLFASVIKKSSQKPAPSSHVTGSM